MKISIITAVYNGADSIRETLNSVAKQNHESIEHIVVDGGSSDSTLETVRLNGERVAHVISGRDEGVYDAFNKGLRLATGDAVAFLNCGDTYMSSTVVSRMVKELETGGTEAAFGDVSIVNFADHNREVRRYSSKRFTPGRMALGLMPAHPTLFLLRDVYKRVGEYDTRFRIAGDFELCLRVFACKSINYRYVPETLVRMPNGGLSNRGWRSKWEITREMQKACSLNGVRTNVAMLSTRFPWKILEML